MQITRLTPVVAAVLIASMGTALLSVPLYAGTIQEKVSVAADKTITPQEEAAISSAGIKVLRHIAQARADIHNKDADAAQAELGQADTLLDIIHEALPTSSIKDRIWVAKKHLEYEDTQEVLPDLIPIYSSLNEMMDVMPVKAARAQLDKAKEDLKAGDKTGARKSLDETDAALQYTEVDLPLSATRHLVTRARAELENKNLDKADKSLQSAEESVVYISVGFEQPLFAAKAALTRSVIDADLGNNDLAGADLKKAIGYLEAAQQSSDAATRDAAGELLGEARQLSNDLQNGGNFSSRIHRLLERAHAYADRSIQYLASGWERYRAEGQPLKSNLIEARLHLANAQIDLFTSHQPDMASKELGQADGFLDKALQVAGSTQKESLTELQNGIKSLSGDPSGGGLAQYARLQRQLDNLIGRL